jgi:hypothetical protein
MCLVYRAEEKAKSHTQRNVIDEQSTRKDLFNGKLIPPFGGVNHAIIAPTDLISICHGEDQLPLKAGRLQNNLGT